MNRREFLDILAKSAVATSLSGCGNLRQASQNDLYQLTPFGNARLIHMTDTHAQLLPIYFREPNVNLGFGDALNRPPHLVGNALLEYAGIEPGTEYVHKNSFVVKAEIGKSAATNDH